MTTDPFDKIIYYLNEFSIEFLKKFYFDKIT